MLLSCYLPAECMMPILKRPDCRAFFVVRDLRMLLQSWYVSTRYTHEENEEIGRRRRAMASMSDVEGLMYMLDRFDEVAEVAKSWLRLASADNIRVVRFEELTGRNGIMVWSDVLRFCDIAIPSDVLRLLADFYSHNRLRPPRWLLQGGPLRRIAYAKYAGVKLADGTWSPEIEARFAERYGSLNRALGYSDPGC
jgi:hypothetical protein